MIIFDRFLCCISLKFFGKFLGWIGTMLSLGIAYAFLLIRSAKSAHQVRFFGEKISDEKIGIVCGVCFVIALIHILLICGIKFKKSLAILPYIIYPIIVTSVAVCYIPKFYNLSTFVEDENVAFILEIVIYVVSFIICLYLTLCLYSLYEIVRIDEKRRKLFKNDPIYVRQP